MSTTHNSTEFFIDGKMVLIRPLKVDEEIAAKTYDDLQDDFLTYGEFDNPPEKPLSEYCGSTTDHHMVFVAVTEGDNEELIGIALYVENQTTEAHEYAVLISPEYAASRLAFEFTSALAKDAADSGVKTLWTTASSENLKMAHIARDLKMSSRITEYRRIKYSLQVDKHPDVVKVFSHREHS